MNSNHWVGVNRISNSSTQGVVDENTKVWGTNNLVSLHHTVLQVTRTRLLTTLSVHRRRLHRPFVAGGQPTGHDHVCRRAGNLQDPCSCWRSLSGAVRNCARTYQYPQNLYISIFVSVEWAFVIHGPCFRHNWSEVLRSQPALCVSATA